jgi:hypothetical protein
MLPGGVLERQGTALLQSAATSKLDEGQTQTRQSLGCTLSTGTAAGRTGSGVGQEPVLQPIDWWIGYSSQMAVVVQHEERAALCFGRAKSRVRVAVTKRLDTRPQA